MTINYSDAIRAGVIPKRGSEGPRYQEALEAFELANLPINLTETDCPKSSLNAIEKLQKIRRDEAISHLKFCAFVDAHPGIIIKPDLPLPVDAADSSPLDGKIRFCYYFCFINFH